MPHAKLDWMAKIRFKFANNRCELIYQIHINTWNANALCQNAAILLGIGAHGPQVLYDKPNFVTGSSNSTHRLQGL